MAAVGGWERGRWRGTVEEEDDEELEEDGEGEPCAVVGGDVGFDGVEGGFEFRFLRVVVVLGRRGRCGRQHGGWFEGQDDVIIWKIKEVNFQRF